MTVDSTKFLLNLALAALTLQAESTEALSQHISVLNSFFSSALGGQGPASGTSMIQNQSQNNAQMHAETTSNTPSQVSSAHNNQWSLKLEKDATIPAVMIMVIATSALVYGYCVYEFFLKKIDITVPKPGARSKNIIGQNSNGAMVTGKGDIDHPDAHVEVSPGNLEATPGSQQETDNPEGVGLLEEHDDADPQEIIRQMIYVSDAITEGANAFMWSESLVIIPCIILGAIVLLAGLHSGKTGSLGEWTAFAFISGSLTSLLAGWIGMKVAVYANVRTAHQCWWSLDKGFNAALLGGSVMGFTLVGLGIASFVGTMAIISSSMSGKEMKSTGKMIGWAHATCGYGLGASLVALFARVGGGIYTKAADVGADLSGKNEYGLDEDDPRNPACIADNVGDNVGDIAGMGADLFGSFAEASAAALYIWNCYCADVTDKSNKQDPTASPLTESYASQIYPLMVSASGILSGFMSMAFSQVLGPIQKEEDVETRLKNLLLIATLFQTLFTFIVGHMFLPSDKFTFRSNKGTMVDEQTDIGISVCVWIGLWIGMAIGMVTEYYTSHSYHPVRETAEAYKQSASTGLILGTALGYKSTLIPITLIAAGAAACLQSAGPFGVAMAGIGMLSTLTIALTIDAYGPIADNAGGIAEMSGLGPAVRRRTDCLDAAGNTTAAVGKGFAVGSAAFVGLALFLSFELAAHENDNLEHRIELLDTFVLSGLFMGCCLPFVFAAWLMTSVAHAAEDMLKECYRQFPGIMAGGRPDYNECINISTRAALREMVAPAVLVLASPIVGGLLFGSNFTCGLLMGILVSGLILAVALSNSGGAYDNAKKFIEAGGLGADIRKGSQPHKNAVVGDTLGDPLKDTSGPSLNIFVKLSAVTSLTLAPFLRTYSPHGGPFWQAPKSQQYIVGNGGLGLIQQGANLPSANGVVSGRGV